MMDTCHFEGSIEVLDYWSIFEEKGELEWTLRLYESVSVALYEEYRVTKVLHSHVGRP